MKTNTRKHLQCSVISAVFAALIAIMTAYICHIPYAAGGGYIHFGDALIFLAASLLPAPYAVFAASVGAGLADLLTAPVWAPFTIVIKAILALLITNRKEKIICKRNLLALIPAAVVTIGGYYLAEGIIYGNFVAPVVSIWGNAVQAVGSAIIYIIVAFALDKSGFKKRFNGLLH